MLLRAYKSLLHQRYDTPSQADAVVRVRCADGVEIALKHFRPPAGATSTSSPVLCLPGLGVDSHNFDAPPPYGLARALAHAGIEAYAIDFRGTGLSTMPFRRWLGVDFDDFVEQDVPAALAHIKATTGAARVSLLGHSMGGIVAYAVVGGAAAVDVDAVVAIASPLGFPTGFDIAPFFRVLRPLSPLVPGLFGGALGRLITPLSLRVDVPYLKNWVLLHNVDKRMARRLYYRAIQDVPRGLVHQFQDWIEHDVVRSKDRHIDYRARLAGCRVPLLVVEAPRDGLAHPTAVRRALGLFAHATHIEASAAAGFAVDYGHIDVIFGKRAPAELFPRIIAFLQQAAPATGGAA
jgi:predicted alpha/beta hydrolase